MANPYITWSNGIAYRVEVFSAKNGLARSGLVDVSKTEALQACNLRNSDFILGLFCGNSEFALWKAGKRVRGNPVNESVECG